jgi:hypothetical protein
MPPGFQVQSHVDGNLMEESEQIAQGLPMDLQWSSDLWRLLRSRGMEEGKRPSLEVSSLGYLSPTPA